MHVSYSARGRAAVEALAKREGWRASQTREKRAEMREVPRETMEKAFSINPVINCDRDFLFSF